jgi:hypothetical protein
MASAKNESSSDGIHVTRRPDGRFSEQRTKEDVRSSENAKPSQEDTGKVLPVVPNESGLAPLLSGEEPAHSQTSRSEADVTCERCPDCHVPIGSKHKAGCDVEQCPHCGQQALLCDGFDSNDTRRQPWTGMWPDEADAKRLGFFIGDDPSRPDLNRLPTECVWNFDRQRWELRPLGDED